MMSNRPTIAPQFDAGNACLTAYFPLCTWHKGLHCSQSSKIRTHACCVSHIIRTNHRSFENSPQGTRNPRDRTSSEGAANQIHRWVSLHLASRSRVVSCQ